MYTSVYMHIHIMYMCMYMYNYVYVYENLIIYFIESELEKSRQCFLYANMPEELGLMLVEFATQKGHPSEADMFITQTVLQYDNTSTTIYLSMICPSFYLSMIYLSIHP